MPIPIQLSADPVRVALIEPPVAVSASDDLTVWRFSDRSVVLRIGSPGLASAETIMIEPHQLTAVWMTLRELDR